MCTYCWATERFLGLEMWKPLFITTWFFSTKPPFSYLRNMNGIICISEDQLLVGDNYSNVSAKYLEQDPYFNSRETFLAFAEVTPQSNVRSDPLIGCWCSEVTPEEFSVRHRWPLIGPLRISGHPPGGRRKGLRAVRRKFGSHHTGFRDTGHMGTILSWGIWLQLKLYEAEYHHSF